MPIELVLTNTLFMNAFIKKIKSDKIIWFSFILSFLLVLISLIYIALFYSKLPPVIPLFNQMPWGEARLAEKQNIFILPAISLFIFVTNFCIAFFVYEKMPLVCRILCATSLLVCLLTLLLIMRTIVIIV